MIGPRWLRCPDPPHARECCWLQAEPGQNEALEWLDEHLPCALGAPPLPWGDDRLDEEIACQMLDRGARVFLTLLRPPGPRLEHRLPGTASLEFSMLGRLDEMQRWASRAGLHWILRLAPLIPLLDDDLSHLESILTRAADHGCRKVLAGCLLVDHQIRQDLRRYLIETGRPPEVVAAVGRMVGEQGPPHDYRHRLYGLIRGMCDRLSLGFGVQELPIGVAGALECNRFLASRRRCCRELEGST